MHLSRPPYLFTKIYPRAVWRMSAASKKIYLSFDDGPVPEVTPWVLDVLKEAAIKATFFCVGENVVNYPEIYKRILTENHAVGNHTHNHLNGWKTPLQYYIDNVEKCAQHIQSGLFRPPHGRLRKDQLNYLEERFSIVMWDVLSGDFDKQITPEKCLKNVVRNVRNGSVIVFHDSYKAKENMQYALPRFISFAKAQGYEFEKIGSVKQRKESI